MIDNEKFPLVASPPPPSPPMEVFNEKTQHRTGSVNFHAFNMHATTNGCTNTTATDHNTNSTNISTLFCFFKFSRFDLDTQTISPPAHDDSFFYIRYPVNGSTAKANGVGLNSISDAITKADIKAKPLTKKQCVNNYGQHTEPCKKYINNKERGKSMQTICLTKFMIKFHAGILLNIC